MRAPSRRLASFVLASLGAAAASLSAQAAAPFTPTRFTVVTEGPTPGKAPDVLLIPGLASSREVFAAEARLLSPSFRLHLVQLSGFAGQPAGPNANGPIFPGVVDELHQYIAANHLQHPAVIGHSMGGLLALMLAQAHPEDVSKLLIVDALPFYGLVFNPNATVEAVRQQGQAMHDGMLAASPEEFAASQPPFIARMVHSPDGLKAVSAASLASDRTVFANAMLEDLTTDLRPGVASVKAPTTVLYSCDPSQGSAADVEALYRSAYAGMPDVHFTRIDNSLHFIMYDQPAAFHNAVLTFLQPKPQPQR